MKLLTLSLLCSLLLVCSVTVLAEPVPTTDTYLRGSEQRVAEPRHYVVRHRVVVLKHKHHKHHKQPVHHD